MPKNRKVQQKNKGKSRKLAKRYAERQQALTQSATADTTESKPQPVPDTAQRPVSASPPQPVQNPHRAKFPENPPFWGRLRIGDEHPTVVIDEKPAWDKQKKKMVDGFVHRELTHGKKTPGLPIKNPDANDTEQAKLERPRKLPQRLIRPLDKDWPIPEELKRPKK